VIQAFADRTTEDLYAGRNTPAARKIAQDLWPIIRRKLDRLQMATELRDLADLPGHRLTRVKGGAREVYEIRVNRQYRIYFRFVEGHAYDVRCGDDH
jgi:toxin HigB-1